MAQIIAEAVKQQVAEALAPQLPPQARKDHVTSQQFSMFIQAQEHKFGAITTMFAQMLSTKPGHKTQAPSLAAAALHRYQDDSVQIAQTLGKRTAQEEIDPRTDADQMDTGGELETTRKRIDTHMGDMIKTSRT